MSRGPAWEGSRCAARDARLAMRGFGLDTTVMQEFWATRRSIVARARRVGKKSCVSVALPAAGPHARRHSDAGVIAGRPPPRPPLGTRHLHRHSDAGVVGGRPPPLRLFARVPFIATPTRASSRATSSTSRHPLPQPRHARPGACACPRRRLHSRTAPSLLSTPCFPSPPVRLFLP